MALNHLKLCKNDRVSLLSRKKSFQASQIHFCKFSEFRPCLSPNPWFGFWGKSGVKYSNLSKLLEITWNFSKMIAYAFFSWKISFWAIQTHFCKFSEFRPCLSPNPWFGLWGSLVWNIVTCQSCLKSLETFSKMIAYAFFHEKYRFDPFKLIF